MKLNLIKGFEMKKVNEVVVGDVVEVLVELDSLLEVGGSGKGKGIGDFCRKVIVKGLVEDKEWLSSKEVLRMVKEEFGDNCSTTEKSIAWYKSELRNDKEKLKKVVLSLGYKVG